MKLVSTSEGNTGKDKDILSVFKEFTGLKANEIHILTLLIDNNGMIVKDLAEVTGFNYITIKEILKSLRDKGLVKSNPEKPVCAEWVSISEVAQ